MAGKNSVLFVHDDSGGIFEPTREDMLRRAGLDVYPCHVDFMHDISGAPYPNVLVVTGGPSAVYAVGRVIKHLPDANVFFYGHPEVVRTYRRGIENAGAEIIKSGSTPAYIAKTILDVE